MKPASNFISFFFQNQEVNLQQLFIWGNSQLKTTQCIMEKPDAGDIKNNSAEKSFTAAKNLDESPDRSSRIISRTR